MSNSLPIVSNRQILDWERLGNGHLGQFCKRSGDQEIDRCWLAGAGLSLLGSGVRIADAVQGSPLQELEGTTEQDRLNGMAGDWKTCGESGTKLRTSASTAGSRTINYTRKCSTSSHQTASAKVIEFRARIGNAPRCWKH